MNSRFNKDYWENKYKENATGWDIGYASTPLTTYFNQLTNKDLRILIPGGGNCYEAEYLFEHGFKNVFVIDIALQPLKNLKKRFPDFPDEHLIHDDFFNHSETYDLIIEQTFFCALDPNLRTAYCNKMHNLLNKNGKVIGLLFNFELTEVGPPFGGSIVEYTKLFYEKFSINVLERCYNSIKPRDGRELFFIFEKN
ncbi:class I SAM-dependent methyltransferase [Lutibacter maritimus]|uniref:Thiopurine S-methyltransferase (TPMT) n=1 Tax=Lutibacter maritimus TaxID=593133 RepID=A0A1I6NZ30_9FLAO|nr:SAM-dependent methyltransferase [Lutibacter maritimus]SFS33216.1 Thiopurine S-methyltransferase (TPMT) [Lutibacter maritimus]